MNITLYGASSDRMDAKYKQAVFSLWEIIAEKKHADTIFFDIPVTFFEKRCLIGWRTFENERIKKWMTAT